MSELATASQAVQSSFQSGQWREQFARSPWLSSTLSVLEQQANLSGQLQSMMTEIGKRLSQFVTGSAWALVELLLTIFVLFYLFRDRHSACDIALARARFPSVRRMKSSPGSQIRFTRRSSAYSLSPRCKALGG